MARDDLIVRFKAGGKDPGWPTIEDLTSGRNPVFVDAQLRDTARRLLARNRLCLVRGAQGRGKTVLSRIVGNSLIDEKWDVWISDLARLEDLSDLVGNVETIGWKKKRRLIIIENAHRAAEADLVGELMDLQQDANFEASLLFTTRWVPQPEDDLETDGPFKRIVENRWVIDLHPDTHTVEEIIRKTVEFYELDAADREWVQRELGSSPNLRLLRWYLDAWLEMPRRRLAQVHRSEVYARVRGEIIDRVDRECREALILVAAILQLDVGFDPSVLEKRMSDSLEHEGLVSLANGFYRMPEHSYDARLITEASASKYRQSADALTVQRVKDYLQRQPRNYVSLLRALIQQENRVLRESLSLRDVTSLSEKRPADPLAGMTGMLNYLLKVYGKTAALKLWQAYEGRLGENKESVQAALKEKITEASPKRILELLNLLNSIDPETRRRLEAFYTIDIVLAKITPNNLLAIGWLLRGRTFDHLEDTTSVIARLAEKLAVAHLFKIGFFLHYLKPSHGDVFLTELIRALHKQPKFLEGISKWSRSASQKYLRLVAQIDPELRREANNLIPEEERYQSLRRSNFNLIRNVLVSWVEEGWLADTVEPRTTQDRIAQRLLKDLSLGGLKTKAATSSGVVRKLSEVLHALTRVRVEPITLLNILNQIPELVDCADPNCPPDQLGMLLGNLRQLDQDVWKIMANKVSDGFNFARVVGQLDAAGPFLLWHVLQIDVDAAHQVANRYFAAGKPCTILDRWHSENSEPDSFATLLHNLAQVDLKSSQEWIAQNTPDEWHASIVVASTSRRFSILLALYLLDANLAKNLLHRLGTEHFVAGGAIKAEDLAFMGLDTYVSGHSRTDVTYPPAGEIASLLLEKHPFSARVFSIYATRKSDPDLARRSLARASRCLYLSRESLDFSDALGKVTQATLRTLLSDALSDTALPEEPRVTFQALVSALKAVLAGHRWINFSLAIEVVATTLEINHTDAQKWLNLAVQSGVLTKEDRPHPSGEGIVTFITLPSSEEPGFDFEPLVAALRSALRGYRRITFNRAADAVSVAFRISREDAKKRLNLALQAGLLKKEEVPHHSGGGVVTFIAPIQEGA
jgi:hypothetical protein